MEKNQYKVMYEIEESHFWFKGMQKISETMIKIFLKKKKNLTILDAGCGTGGALLFLKKYGHVKGIDISDYAIELCKKRGLKNVEVGSIDKLPYLNNSFDLVTCFDVIYHKKVNDTKAILELFRVLKPGGILLLRTSAYNWLYSQHDKLVHTRYRYVKNEVRDLLTKCNFINLKLTYVNSFLFPFIAIKRLLDRIFGISEKKASDVQKVNPLLNYFLIIPFLIESQLVKYINFPFGLSIIAVSKKKK